MAQLNQAQTETPQRYASADTRRFAPTDRFRLAIVADSADALATKLQIAAKQLALPAARPLLERQGIFYRQLGGKRRVWPCYSQARDRSIPACCASWSIMCRRPHMVSASPFCG